MGMVVGSWEMGFEDWRFAQAHWRLWWMMGWLRLMMGQLVRPLERCLSG
jgi:hypothetical protein